MGFQSCIVEILIYLKVKNDEIKLNYDLLRYNKYWEWMFVYWHAWELGEMI